MTDERTSTVVLIHGGRHDGWCWNLVRARLGCLGIESVAPDLPLTGIDDEVRVVRDIVDRLDGDALLVGHSRGGRVLSAAASGAPTVRGLLYVTAMLLEEHELHAPGHQTNSAAKVNAPVDAEVLRERMYHDVPASLFAEAISHLHPATAEELAVAPQTTPAAWRSIHTTYVVCTNDRYVEPSVQRGMARHADRVVELAASHAPFLSRPDELAEIIAEQVRDRPAKPVR